MVRFRAELECDDPIGRGLALLPHGWCAPVLPAEAGERWQLR